MTRRALLVLIIIQSRLLCALVCSCVRRRRLRGRLEEVHVCIHEPGRVELGEAEWKPAGGRAAACDGGCGQRVEEHMQVRGVHTVLARPRERDYTPSREEKSVEDLALHQPPCVQY
jgi:hypothetical protein